MFELGYNNDAVRETAELRRIRGLPWFEWSDGIEEFTSALTQELRRKGGTMQLRPIQAAALGTAQELGGAFLPMRTGSGKALTSLLMSEYMDLPKPLLLLPAAREEPTHQLQRDYGRHFRVRDHFILSYERLSNKNYAEIVDRLAPGLIVADEAHMLADSSGSRWQRIHRYLKRHPHVPFVAMSGSFSGLDKYWHLLRAALKEGAPVPRDPFEMQEWCRVLSPKSLIPLAPGAMMTLAPPGPDEGIGYDAARARYGRRLVGTKGVVSSGPDIPNIPLTCTVVDVAPTAAISELARHLTSTWECPPAPPFEEGYPFEAALDLWRHLGEASCGMFRRWREIPPIEWLVVRKEVHGFIRDAITNSRKGNHPMDTPAQVWDRVRAGTLKDEGLLERWSLMEPTYEPDTVAVWVCDSTLELAAEWLEREGGLCWVENMHFGFRLEKMTGVPYFRTVGCDRNGVHIEQHRGPAICSISSCGVGQNLQHQQKNYIVEPMSQNKVAEQLVSRTMRDGQLSPVTVEWLVRLPSDQKTMDTLRADAQADALNLAAPQRLTVAKWVE